jgi:hypothetical protein
MQLFKMSFSACHVAFGYKKKGDIDVMAKSASEAFLEARHILQKKGYILISIINK